MKRLYSTLERTKSLKVITEDTYIIIINFNICAGIRKQGFGLLTYE